MRTNKVIFIIMILLVGFTSCVSKKKFVSMENLKLSADENIRQLTDENKAKDSRIKVMISDFERMKNELMESNAKKDQMLGDYSGKVNSLKSNVKSTSETMDEKIYAFKFEKRRLNEELNNSRDSVSLLKIQIQSLSTSLSTAKSDLSNIQFDLEREKNKSSRLEGQNSSDNKKYQEQLKTINSLKAEIKNKNEKIEQLQNNVNLLKKSL